MKTQEKKNTSTVGTGLLENEVARALVRELTGCVSLDDWQPILGHSVRHLAALRSYDADLLPAVRRGVAGCVVIRKTFRGSEEFTPQGVSTARIPKSILEIAHQAIRVAIDLQVHPDLMAWSNVRDAADYMNGLEWEAHEIRKAIKSFR